MPWLKLAGAPLLAAAANAAVTWALERAGVPTLLALVPGFGAYIVALIVLGVFRSDDFGLLRARLPRLGKSK
jgi:hypothetical protein